MPRAAPLALLLALAAVLAPTALAATCVYCKGNTRLSCYTGIPIAPTCKWWGSTTEVSLGHCGTLAHCDDVLTRGGVTYDLKVRSGGGRAPPQLLPGIRSAGKTSGTLPHCEQMLQPGRRQCLAPHPSAHWPPS